MDKERTVDHYLGLLDQEKVLKSSIEEIRGLLQRFIDEDGVEDDKGNLRAQHGKYELQRQKRVGKSQLDHEAAIEWARSRGALDEVVTMVPVLNEDAFFAYVLEHSDEPGVEETVQEMITPGKVTWAFIKPHETTNYDY